MPKSIRKSTEPAPEEDIYIPPTTTQRHLISSGVAPCGCLEYYDAKRKTKVAMCEMVKPRPESCTRKVGGSER